MKAPLEKPGTWTEVERNQAHNVLEQIALERSRVRAKKTEVLVENE